MESLEFDFTKSISKLDTPFKEEPPVAPGSGLDCVSTRSRRSVLAKSLFRSDSNVTRGSMTGIINWMSDAAYLDVGRLRDAWVS